MAKVKRRDGLAVEIEAAFDPWTEFDDVGIEVSARLGGQNIVAGVFLLSTMLEELFEEMSKQIPDDDQGQRDFAADECEKAAQRLENAASQFRRKAADFRGH